MRILLAFFALCFFTGILLGCSSQRSFQANDPSFRLVRVGTSPGDDVRTLCAIQLSTLKGKVAQAQEKESKLKALTSLLTGATSALTGSATVEQIAKDNKTNAEVLGAITVGLTVIGSSITLFMGPEQDNITYLSGRIEDIQAQITGYDSHCQNEQEPFCSAQLATLKGTCQAP
jgi:hypothetical protein